MNQIGDKLTAKLNDDVRGKTARANGNKQFFSRGMAQGRSTPKNMVAPKIKKPATIRVTQADRQRTRIIMDLVSMSTGVSLNDLKSHTRSTARAARARQICMYLSYVAFQWPLARIGRAFDRDRTTAAYACRLIEDLRDDQALDERLSQLEACIENMPKAKEIKLLSPNLREMIA